MITLQGTGFKGEVTISDIAENSGYKERPSAAPSVGHGRLGLSVPMLADILLGLAAVSLLALSAWTLWQPADMPETTPTPQTADQQTYADMAEDRFAILSVASPFLKTEVPAAQTDNLPLTNLNISLLGIRLAEVGDSSAILRTSGNMESAFIIGEDVMPGVRLSGIYIDHIVLSRGGRQERLFLDGTDTRNLNR